MRRGASFPEGLLCALSDGGPRVAAMGDPRVRDLYRMLWIPLVGVLFCAFIAGLTWDPVAAYEGEMRSSINDALSIAAGAAAGLKLDGKPQTVFALLGDGECQEGQVWEAAMFAAHRKLDNLIAIIDRNGLQIGGSTEEVCDPGDIAAKFQTFGWDAREVDGHDIPALVEALGQAKADRGGKPHAFIARTVKGKGVSFMEGQAGWHGKAPNAEQLAQALADLGYDGGEEACRG